MKGIGREYNLEGMCSSIPVFYIGVVELGSVML